MASARPIEDLERMSDDDLRAEYNRLVGSTVVGLEWFRDELHRRELDRRTRKLELLTWAIAVRTAANVVLVAVSVFK